MSQLLADGHLKRGISASRVLRLERLETRQLLSANPILKSSLIAPDDYGHEESLSHELSRIAQVEAKSTSNSVVFNSFSYRPDLREMQPRRSFSIQPNFESQSNIESQSRTVSVFRLPTTVPIEITFVAFFPATIRESNSVTMKLDGLSSNISVPHSSLAVSSETSQTRNESTRTTPEAVSASQLNSNSKSNESAVPHSTEIFVSLAPRERLETIDRAYRASEIVISLNQEHAVPRVDDLKIHRWLEDSEQLQDKFSELDRTLQELAEEQSLRISSGRDTRPFHIDVKSRVRTDSLKSDWLDRTTSIPLEAAKVTTSPLMEPSEIENRFADVTTAGWNVGVRIYRAFETGDAPSEVEFASALVSLEGTPGKSTVNESDSEQSGSSKTDGANEAVIVGLALSALGYWGVRRKRAQPSGNCEADSARLLSTVH